MVAGSQFFASQIGIKQSLTPEGFLLCEDVPIARTGIQLYGEHEGLPVEPGGDGIVRIQRDADEVFRPETIRSAMGKPCTDDHPPEDVTPENWRGLACGTMFNPRRGQGVLDDFLLADLLITDAGAIKAIRVDGKREVSCGYDADYEQIEPGLGRQKNIVINHLALVNAARCGPSCAIGDEAMATAAKRTVWDRLMTAFKAKDEAAFEEELKNAKAGDDVGEVSGSGTHVHLHMAGSTGGAEAGATDETAGAAEAPPKWFSDFAGPMSKRMDSFETALAGMKVAGAATTPAADAEGEGAENIEGSTEEKAPSEAEATGDRKSAKDGNVKDSAEAIAALKTVIADALARAEILSPGAKLPTMDGITTVKATLDTLCAFRRGVLAKAYATEDGKAAIEPMLAGRSADFSKMTCDAASMVFTGASELMRMSNNHMSGVITNALAHDHSTVKVPTIAEINARNRKAHGFAAR